MGDTDEHFSVRIYNPAEVKERGIEPCSECWNITPDAFLKEYLMYGYIGLAVLLVLANAMFVLYDIFLTRMISLLINFFIPKYLTFLR